MFVIVFQDNPLSIVYSKTNGLLFSGASHLINSNSPGTKPSPPTGYVNVISSEIISYVRKYCWGPYGTAVPLIVKPYVPDEGFLIVICSILFKSSIPWVATALRFDELGVGSKTQGYIVLPEGDNNVMSKSFTSAILAFVLASLSCQ